MEDAKREVELKFRVADEAALRRRLLALHARCEGRFAEENYFCDDPAGSLKASDRVLRLRRSTMLRGPGGRRPKKPAVDERLTYKEPVPDPRFKVRREVEIAIGDLDSMRLVLESLAFTCRHGYTKEREIWHFDDVLVTLDALPYGHFAELEGEPEAIARVAAHLGFDLSQGITESYLTLGDQAPKP